MDTMSRGLKWVLLCLVCQFCVSSVGCFNPTCGHCHPCEKPPCDVPRELAKLSLPAYIIEPPDILLVDALRVVPLPPYKIEPLDALLIQATGVLPDQPISGIYSVEPDGRINLGLNYGSVQVSGMTIDEAKKTIEKQLQLNYKDPKVLVALGQSRAMQQIRGEHLVRPDGTVGLGVYGSVYVAGMTLDEAKSAIEGQLSQYLLEPQVSLDVFAYNSKVYYIVIDGGGYGETVYRLPITGNETVLDAMALINGLPAVSSKHHMWLARPRPASACCDEKSCDQILPINWNAVAECGNTGTNYQLFPGDRIFVQADTLICTDNWLAKIYSPIERTFGVVLLGTTTVNAIRTNPNNNNNNNNNSGR